MVTQLAKGKTLKEAEEIKYEDVMNSLGGLPKVKVHCSMMAQEALKKAIKDYENKKLENKHVGFMILGIAVVFIIIIFLFQNALTQVTSSSCSMEKNICPMYKTINTQTYLALSVTGLLVIIGLVLIFVKPKEKIIIKTKKEKKKKINLERLEKNEKEVIEILQKENGAIFQSTLMEKLGIGKVGITRLLDKLEAKQFIERKRRGMNNIVVLKN